MYVSNQFHISTGMYLSQCMHSRIDALPLCICKHTLPSLPSSSPASSSWHSSPEKQPGLGVPINNAWFASYNNDTCNDPQLYHDIYTYIIVKLRYFRICNYPLNAFCWKLLMARMFCAPVKRFFVSKSVRLGELHDWNLGRTVTLWSSLNERRYSTWFCINPMISCYICSTVVLSQP